MDEDEYTTVEHDFQQMKSFQKSLKFVFIEKMAKINMMEGIKTRSWHSDEALCERLQSELYEVKEKNMAMGDEFEKISIGLAAEKKEISEIERNNRDLEREIEDREKIIKDLIMKDEKNREKTYFTNLKNSQKAEIEALMCEMEKIESIDLKPLMERSDVVRKRRDSLSRKQKRHSMVFYEDVLKECYQWYKALSAFIEEMNSVKISTRGTTLDISFGAKKYSFSFQDNRFVAMTGYRETKIEKM
ncbi:hypothetical protein EQH57_1081 [Dictyocoela roeselum]|nr:hypothetical protein EQH57_1081 [Dictyocoela roeselum]